MTSLLSLANASARSTVKDGNWEGDVSPTLIGEVDAPRLKTLAVDSFALEQTCESILQKCSNISQALILCVPNCMTPIRACLDTKTRKGRVPLHRK